MTIRPFVWILIVALLAGCCVGAAIAVYTLR